MPIDDDSQDAVFRALADPSRRRILDLLLDRDGRTLTELEEAFEMTRFGVMKHVRVLIDAGLVVTRKQGRSTLHFLNTVPIRLVHDRWIDKFTEQRVTALVDLKTVARATEPEGVVMTAQTTQVVPEQLATQVYRILIRTTPEQLWEALVSPGFTARYFHGARITVTPAHYQAFGPDDAVWGDASVYEWDRPRRLVHGWRSLYDPQLSGEPESRVSWEIEDQDDGTCLLTATHSGLERSPLTAQSVSGVGWTTVISGLKTLLETGEPMVPSA